MDCLVRTAVAGTQPMVQTQRRDASSRPLQIRPRNSASYAIPGLPWGFGLLQLRHLQSLGDHECRPSTRWHPDQPAWHWRRVYALWERRGWTSCRIGRRNMTPSIRNFIGWPFGPGRGSTTLRAKSSASF